MLWVVTPQVLALLGLATRLCWRTIRERGRQKTLRELAGSLTNGTGGAVEIDDVDRDGSRLRVRVVVTGAPRRGQRR